MALSVHLFDLPCFLMLAGLLAASLWAIASRESCCVDGGADYEQLLLSYNIEEGGGSGGGGGGVGSRRSNTSYVAESQLWLSRWPAVHPAWLLALRLLAVVSMIGVLLWDLETYDWTIMLYYTEYDFLRVMAGAVADDEGLGYWMRWQIPVCAAIIFGAGAASVGVIAKTTAAPVRSEDLWKPCWRRTSPYWLLALRAQALLILSWLLYQMVLLDGAFAFYFYTQWTASLLIFYFLIATLISARGCWNYSKRNTTFSKRELEENKILYFCYETNETRKAGREQKYQEQLQSDRKAGFWGYLMQVAYQTSAGAVLLTDIIFWALLVPFLSIEHFNLDLLMCCMHTLNFVFLLLDTALNSLPFPWFRMAYFIIWSCVYVVFQWLLHACGFSWWPYPFLELSTPWAPFWYLSLALIHIPCYGLYTLIVKIKSLFFPKSYNNVCISS